MVIVITEWALQSYLDLVGRAVITSQDYWTTLRPGVEKLRRFPQDPAFADHKFWGPATDKGGNPVAGGFKMKWHNLGPGRVQLRLCVALHAGRAFLCQAYSKTSDAQDKREAARLKRYINEIASGRHVERGYL